MSELSHFFSALAHRAQASRHRDFVCIESDQSWGIEAAQSALPLYSSCLWLGEHAPDGVHALLPGQAKSWLGQDCDCLVVDLHCGFDVEALAALAGTIRGGGLMILLLPRVRAEIWQTPFMQRFLTRLQAPEVLFLTRQSDGQIMIPALPNDAIVPVTQPVRPYGCLSEEQVTAVEAVRRVVTGHRRRPLVITADRGRGKSSALGIAAATLMQEKARQIVVTAPRQRHCQTLFHHAARVLGASGFPGYQLASEHSTLSFWAPDRLLEALPETDLLIVDEAAAIPAPLLQKMLASYSRVVFASTVHGYEGTGRGFAIKFKAALDVMTPNWRAVSMNHPIRWAENDPLEQWLFQTLLLDAEPSAVALPLQSETLEYRQVSPQWLLARPDRLSSLFGLLIHAHYQTSPADLRQLLDDETVSVFVALQQDTICGCALVSREGGFSAELAEAVCQGKRRPKGHLLAQSVAAHLGLAEAASQHCGRVLRIAVHDDARQLGVGSALLACIYDWARQQKLDYLGTSFAASGELLPFWQKAGYLPVRLGVAKDAASGCHSLLSVRPLSVQTTHWFETAQVSFSLNFMAQACEQFQSLESDVFIPLYLHALRLSSIPELLETTEQQLRNFSQGGLGYDLIIGQLSLWLQHQMKSGRSENKHGLEVMVAKIIQRQSWSSVQQQFSLSGRKQAELFLRDFVAKTLTLPAA
ncbi:tRNA(Met) cytidine acetyltransferase TmcA [Photobacterium sp. R1]